jgi:hypothetical protein
MTLADRDAVVVTLLSKLAPLSGIQAANEVVRIMGRDNASVVGGYVGAELVTDVTGLQQAVVDLANATNRANATTQLATLHGAPPATRAVTVPCPPTVSTTDHYRMRVVAAGH